jgi:2-polyprenyl-3-methyl-5-hydroxy-6-metoxy-1,4-benzoquinol methylase
MSQTTGPNAQWNLRYGDEEYFYGTTPNDFLRENAHLIPQGSVLCVADGEGREVSSVDISDVGVAKTKKLASEKGVSVDAQVGDLADFDLGRNKWQGVVSIFAHLPTGLRQDLHRRVVESLAPGGVVLLEAYTVDQIGRGTGGPQVPELLMSAESLSQEFAALEIIHLKELERNVVEGSGHTGLAAVVQLIARKHLD